MRNTGLKIIVVVLFLFQALIGFISIYVLKDIIPNKLIVSGLIINNEVLLGLLIGSIIISIFFVILIITRVGKTITIVKEIPIMQIDKGSKEPKKKKDQDKDLKLAQQQNEKKAQMLNELTRNLNDQLSLENYSNQALINISRQFDIFQGIFFIRDTTDNVFRKAGTYAYYTQEDLPEFTDGVGLTGQVAINKKILNISNLPDKYITVLSGLGKSSPSNLLILPILTSDKTIGIVELASFIKFDSAAEQILENVSLSFGQHIENILKKSVDADKKEISS